ncbi:MAG: hypothetical protein R6X08_00395, partial [Desulfosalsimonadaceae bacterium]
PGDAASPVVIGSGASGPKRGCSIASSCLGPYGAFFGGLVFGLIENTSYTMFALIPGVEPFALTRFLSFLILLIILLIRPTGIIKAK